ncbi:MAG: putative permease super family [Bacteroidetes bacterium]|jgi:drug/metabolite transporter (DMT)-like permease|nr:putative permease super family [Bacteroidota bacterium]
MAALHRSRGIAVSDMPFFGEIAALLTALCWSGSSLVFSSATARVGPALVNISRLVLALVYLALLLLILGESPSLSTSQVIFLGVSGIVGLAIGDSFLFRAYVSIGPRLSMLVMSISPAFSAFLAYIFLDERLSLLGISGIAITVCGVVLVVYERSPGSMAHGGELLTGILFAGVAAVGQGAALLFAKFAFNEGPIDGFVAAAVRIGVSIGVLLPIMIALGRIVHPVQTFCRDRRAFWLTAAGSVLGPFLGISFSLLAVANTKVGIASTLMATVPIIMLPMVRFFFKERLSWRAMIGAWIAVAGVAILFLH